MRIKNLTAFLLLTLFATNAHAQMRLVKSNSFNYVNDSLNLAWYLDYVYGNPQQLFYSEMARFTKDSTGIFNNNQKTIYTRDSEGSVTESLRLSWDGTQWINSNKQTNTYDLFGNSIRYSSFNWEFGNWKENIRDVTTYNSNNQLIQEVQMYGFFQDPLTNHSKNDYEYDFDGRLINHIIHYWDDVNNRWNTHSKRVYLYKGATSVIDSSFVYGWNSNLNNYNTISSKQYLYNYNASNQLIAILEQNYANQTWGNIKKDEYQYHSSGKQSRHAQYMWYNNMWNFQEEQEEDFDAQGRIALKIRITYDSIQNLKTTYTYASDSSLITEKYENWVNGAWKNNSFYEHIYEAVQQLPSAVAELTVSSAKAYPNPFAVNTIIEFETPVSGITNIKIFSATGKLVNETKLNTRLGTNNWLWNGDDTNGMALPKGMYIVQLQTANQINTFKLFKN